MDKQQLQERYNKLYQRYLNNIGNQNQNLKDLIKLESLARKINYKIIKNNA